MKSSEVIAGVGLADSPRKSHWPARMDLAQSASGLLLGLFMWGHMFFVSSIVISNDVMWMVTKAFEGYYVFGRAFPQLVSGVVAIVSVLFTAHAFLAMRKFPADSRQYRLFIGHKNLLRHPDTQARQSTVDALKAELAPSGRFAVQEALMPYEDLLLSRFRGPNERIDERF